MPNKARDHFETLRCLCSVCGRKKGLRDALKFSSLIQNVLSFYDYSSDLCPKKICTTCRIALVEKQDKPESTRRLPLLLNYEQMFPRRSNRTGGLPYNPESGKKCECPLCDIGRLSMDEYVSYHQTRSFHCGS